MEQLCETFNTILETTTQDYGHAVRSVHAKAHGVLEGTLTVDDGLPRELAQGLFAKPGQHKVYMRISTYAGDILPDAVSLPRGMALKVLDVEGERLPGAKGAAQDFIMVNGKVFQAKTAEKFLGSLKMLSKTMQWAGNLAMRASPKATIDCVNAFARTDFRPDMAHFKVPTLVIHGDADETVPVDISGRAAAAAISGARLEVYEGAPYATPFTEKEHLPRDLLEFLAA